MLYELRIRWCEVWEFSYLDYSFDVLISQIGNLGLYNGFTIFTSLDVSLPALMCLCSRHSSHCMLFNSDLSIHLCFFYARLLTLILPLVRKFLTPLDLYVQILKLKSWWTSCWSKWRDISVVDQQLCVRGPILPDSVLVSQVFLF